MESGNKSTSLFWNSTTSWMVAFPSTNTIPKCFIALFQPFKRTHIPKARWFVQALGFTSLPQANNTIFIKQQQHHLMTFRFLNASCMLTLSRMQTPPLVLQERKGSWRRPRSTFLIRIYSGPIGHGWFETTRTSFASQKSSSFDPVTYFLLFRLETLNTPILPFP